MKTIPIRLLLAASSLAGGTMDGLEYTIALNILTQELSKRLREDLVRFRLSADVPSGRDSRVIPE